MLKVIRRYKTEDVGIMWSRLQKATKEENLMNEYQSHQIFEKPSALRRKEERKKITTIKKKLNKKLKLTKIIRGLR